MIIHPISFTLDYELFGDGSGDVYVHQIETTYKLVETLETYGAKLTVFFEYGQYLFYERFAEREPQFAVRNKLIRSQLVDLIKRGHDVQLHLHPTWIGASIDQGVVILKASQFDITKLEDDLMLETLKDGKRFLEELLVKYNPNYKCIAFRAGAWSANKSHSYISALTAAGFEVDSTVVRGAYLDSSYGKFDFRKCVPDSFWFINKSLTRSGLPAVILELPIMSLVGYRHFLKNFSRKRIKIHGRMKTDYPVKLTDKNLTKMGKLKKIIKRNYIMGDFNFLSSNSLKNLTKLYLRKTKGEIIPIILIGHSKTSFFNDELEPYLKYVCEHPELYFSTISDINIYLRGKKCDTSFV